MFDFGDDILIDGYRIPWLIWIQILIMFLLTLTILLTYFELFALDSNSSSALVDPTSACSQFNQVAQNRGNRREIETSTGNRARAIDNNAERDGASTKDLASAPAAERLLHPCRYFDLAKNAFLKCLGLGSGSGPSNSSSKDHEHED